LSEQAPALPWLLKLVRKKLENKRYKKAPNSALSMEGYLRAGLMKGSDENGR